MKKSNIICNKPYMKIKLTQVSDAYLESSQISMMEFLSENS